MTAEEYIQQNPYQFKDEIDKWLFREFNIIGGACSSQESFRYSVAREVAEKAIEYTKEQMKKDAIEETVYCDRFRDQNVVSHWFGWDDGFKAGDKVKLIIIKED